ncbi:MAG: FliH/SctL family protein [Gemmatimonadaceae bacterium]|jgi:flagellar biosynthesis/type III secretory pathway protein FliH|nr:FliH/SctL family protein [Gemmatimonadaceae bacterium]
MSSSEREAFVADVFGAAFAAPATQDAMPWALDELPMDDVFGEVDLTQEPLAASFGVPGEPAAPARPAIDPEELARLEAEAFARGRAEGEVAGRAQGEAAARAALDAPIATLRATAHQLAAGEARWLAVLEENVSAIAVAVAQHIIERELSFDPAAVLPVIRTAVERFPLDQPLTVRVHPDDVPVVQDALVAPLGAPGVRELRVAPDPSMQRGGALVEGRERIVDGRVDTALERIFRAITRVQA